MKNRTLALLAALAIVTPAAFAQNQQAQALNLPPSNQEFAPIPEGYDTERPAIAHGKLEYVEYDSKSIGMKRRMAVYTPPGYSAAEKYPVIYLLHGRGDDETGWPVKGSAAAILDNVIADGKMLPAVVVMPNGQASRGTIDGAQQAAVTAMNQKMAPLTQAATAARADLNRTALSGTAAPADLAAKVQALASAEEAAALARAAEFAALQQTPRRLNPDQVAALRGAPVGGDGWVAFEQDLIRDIIPYIETHYSVRTDRLNRALLGLSMGGGQTLNYGLTNQNLFAWVAAFSPAPNARPMAELIPSAAQTNQNLRLFWISCGDTDTLVGAVSRNALTALDQMGVKYLWRRGTGGHIWPLWKNDLYTVSQMLFR